MKILRRVGAFTRRHKRAEEDAVTAVGLEVLWTIVRRVGLIGVGAASAAVLAPGLVDLSNNNGPAAASVIRASGVRAVEAKATEGLAFHDRDYPVFRAAAVLQRRPFGGYLFLHPDLNGVAQARYFLAYAKPKPGDLQPVVDSETGSPSAAAASTYAALHEMTLHGFRPILYASSSYVAALVAADPRLKAFRVWQAEYGPTLHTVPGVTVIAWQFTDRAHVLGFSVDGSHLLVRSVVQLEIPRPVEPKPVPKPVPKLTAPVVLRAKTGEWSWIAWRFGQAAWRGYARAAPSVRPHVRKTIPAAWWRDAAKHGGTK